MVADIQDEIYIEPHDPYTILFGVGMVHVHKHEPGDTKQVLVPMTEPDIERLIRRLEKAKKTLQPLPES